MCMAMRPCEEDLCYSQVLAVMSMNSLASVVRFIISMKSLVSVGELHDLYELIWISMSFMTNMNSPMTVGEIHDKYELTYVY